MRLHKILFLVMKVYSESIAVTTTYRVWSCNILTEFLIKQRNQKNKIFRSCISFKFWAKILISANVIQI
ncbi:hypothetical protein APR42_04860 [Salegentibacter mishustinae]|uniref:Uncharacterized protein n=1 Tax=Salegentibacter mishustinae TaxID=270918 RepID=A0A0Q9Z8K1_9FLAO|nr:hypothetical protein APR42_04860 [Salegentibacter mishustinae]